MRILVTGGAGFIGSNLCLSLLEDGHEVYIIDNCSTGKNWDEISRKVHHSYRCDIGKDHIYGVFRGIDIIFNLVGRTSHGGSMKCPEADVMSNILAPLNVLMYAYRECKDAKIVYTGSRSQYGKIQYNPVDENHPIKPLDINGINKYTTEQYHQLYAEHYGMNITCLRLPNIFGPRHQIDVPDGVLNWFIAQALRGEKIKIYGGIRDILYIDECVSALKLAVNTSTNTYNIGGRGVSLNEFVNKINKIIPVDYECIKYTNKLEVGDYIANASKFQEATGWKLSSKSLEDMINETIDHYRR